MKALLIVIALLLVALWYNSMPETPQEATGPIIPVVSATPSPHSTYTPLACSYPLVLLIHNDNARGQYSETCITVAQSARYCLMSHTDTGYKISFLCVNDKGRQPTASELAANLYAGPCVYGLPVQCLPDCADPSGVPYPCPDQSYGTGTDRYHTNQPTPQPASKTNTTKKGKASATPIPTPSFWACDIYHLPVTCTRQP